MIISDYISFNIKQGTASPHFIFLVPKGMENIGGGMAALSKSAVGP